MATSLPFLIALCGTLWLSPFPISEAVGQFEDIAEAPASLLVVPRTSYYRPLFHLTLWTLWRGTPSLETFLSSIRLLHIVALSMLVLLLIWHIRPRRAIDAAAATVAVAVLLGSPGLLGNLELPLSYTIVGMPAALMIWILLERDHHFWHGPAIIALTLVAIGFKEQGLVIVPLVIVAWWVGAPGARRGTVAALTCISLAYVAFRLGHSRSSWPPFEQDVGFGFSVLSITDADARFGAFPLWIYAYNSLSTIANVMFAEPTEGVFRIVRALSEGQTQPWHIVWLLSSTVLTGLIVWWGLGALRRTARGQEWSPESRLFIATVVSLAACGVLSFDYSRERLAGMAVPFYALAAYWAVRAAAVRVGEASRATVAMGAIALVLLAGAWQFRAIYSIEFTRQRAVNAQREWLTDLNGRRTRFAGRPICLRIMQQMIAQGTASNRIQRTRYPRWMIRMLGEY